MSNQKYFPESENELDRLVSKTDRHTVIEQAFWAGIKPGMRVLDVGCGPGITTTGLAQAVGPGGSVVGIDRSKERLDYARNNSGASNVEYSQRNFFDDLSDLGSFDFIWARFILEYFLAESFQLASHLTESLKPGGICCFADLDHNSLNHYGSSERLAQTIQKIGASQMRNNNFDPYVGRKLSTYLYDLGFENIRVDVLMHHLVYGNLTESDKKNWRHKIEVAGRRSGWTFDEYEDGFDGFEREFSEYIANPRRFIYTPLIIASGTKPASN